MEVWLLAFCGGYGLLVGAFVVYSAELQGLCLGFLLLALVRTLVPALTHRQGLFSGFAALALAALIYAHPASAGVNGPYFYLLMLLAVGYPLVMNGPMTLGFGACLLLVYLGLGWSRPPTVTRELFGLQALLLAGVCLLSARMGHTLRQSQWLFEILLHDRESLAHNDHGLRFYGERLMRQSLAEHQPCALALLRMPHTWLPDAAAAAVDAGTRPQALTEQEQSKKGQSAALQSMAGHLARALPPRSLVARTSTGDWVLLVGRMTRQRLLRQLMTAFGHPLQLPFGEPHEEMFVPLTPCVVETSPELTDLDTLVGEAYAIWSRSERTGTVSLYQ